MARKVLFITADQWRGDALGFLGNPAARTPHLDRLAAEGTTFAAHYTNAAPCGPARASLLTGLYPHIHRSVRNGTPLDQRHTNLALEARRAGFDPILFGYTDSSADPRAVAPGDARLTNYEGFLPGFHVAASLNMTCLADWLGELAKRGYDVPDTHADIWRQAGSPPVMDRFSRAPARYRAEDSDTAFIADKVIDHIRCRRDENWFIHAVFLRPHPPLIAPAPYNELIDVADLPPLRRGSERAAELGQHAFLETWAAEQETPAYFSSQVDVHAVSEAERDAMRAVYFGLIAEVDAQVGRIIAHLEATGEFDETLIVFTSDHGEMLGDHWLWGKGGWFDAAYHVPLIVRAPETPRAARGRMIGHFTEAVDLMPTVLAWLGLAAPAEASGFSLMPWLRGSAPARWRRHAFWEFDMRSPVSGTYEQALGISSDECTLNVLRDRDFKYVHFTSLAPLLYDLRSDPHELVNVADDPAYAGVRADYASRLLTHRMLHAERTLANMMLSPDGLVVNTAPRGMPDQLFESVEPAPMPTAFSK